MRSQMFSVLYQRCIDRLSAEYWHIAQVVQSCRAGAEVIYSYFNRELTCTENKMLT